MLNTHLRFWTAIPFKLTAATLTLVTLSVALGSPAKAQSIVIRQGGYQQSYPQGNYHQPYPNTGSIIYGSPVPVSPVQPINRIQTYPPRGGYPSSSVQVELGFGQSRFGQSSFGQIGIGFGQPFRRDYYPGVGYPAITTGPFPSSTLVYPSVIVVPRYRNGGFNSYGGRYNNGEYHNGGHDRRWRRH